MNFFSHKMQIARTPANRYYQIIHLDNSIKPPPSDAVKFYLDQLKLLANLLPIDKFFCQIEGGMAVALHDGKFSRHHCDVDVAVAEHELVKVERQLQSSGYRLFSRNSIHAFEYLPWDVFNSFSAGQILARKRVKRLTAVKVDAQGRIDNSSCLLPRFDVHIHRIEKEYILLDRGDVEFPCDLFAQSRTIELEGQHQIVAASLPLMYYYKLSGRRQRHRFDLTLIEKNENFTHLDRDRVKRIYQGLKCPLVMGDGVPFTAAPILVSPHRNLPPTSQSTLDYSSGCRSANQ